MSTQEYFIDGRVLVNGRKGHLNLGFPIKFSDILASVYTLVPQLQANPYYFFNGLTVTSLQPSQHGTEITLGGLLTQGTTIDGDSSHMFIFGNLTDFILQSLHARFEITTDLEFNIDGNWINTVLGNVDNIVTGIVNHTADKIYSTALTIQNNADTISNYSQEFIAEVTDEFRFINTVFDDCNNLTHEIISKELNSFTALLTYDGYKNNINGSYTVPSLLDPMVFVNAQVESGFYISDNYNDNCSPRSFINAHSSVDDTTYIENSSIIEVNTDSVLFTVVAENDLVDNVSTLVFEASDVNATVRDNNLDRQTSLNIDSQYVSIAHQDGLNSSDYSLPSLGNPDNGDMILMDANKIGRFIPNEVIIQTRTNANDFNFSQYAPIQILFNALPYGFKYKLKRVYVEGVAGTLNDTATFIIEDFTETVITDFPVTLELLAPNFHPSFIDMFYVATGDNIAQFDSCVHDGGPSKWLLKIVNTGMVGDWAEVSIGLVFSIVNI